MASEDGTAGAGFLTTHVLDTARGCPAQGMVIWLYKVNDQGQHKIAEAVTNADGRTNEPILPSGYFEPGQYELIFFVGNYLRALGMAGPEPLFLDHVPIRFGMSQDDHYHVPLLVSPYGYSTYRGS